MTPRALHPRIHRRSRRLLLNETTPIMHLLPRTLCLTLAVFLVLGAGYGAEATAQDLDDVEHDVEAETDTLDEGNWGFDLRAALTGSQSAYREVPGRENSLTVTGRIDGTAVRDTENWLQSHRLRLRLGAVQQGDDAFRKAEDRIDLRSALQFRGDEGFFRLFRPTIAGRLLTQFAADFERDEFPEELDTGEEEPELPVKVRSFFSPAELTQTIGLTYDGGEGFTQRLGFASRQNIEAIPRFRPLRDVSPGSLARVEFGAESETTIRQDLAENVALESQLNIFLAGSRVENPDLFWETSVFMEVTRLITVDVDLILEYDQSEVDALQVRQALSLGLSFTLI